MAESFYVGCLCLYAATFQTLEACIFHCLMSVRPSLDGATGQFRRRFPATLMGNRKVRMSTGMQTQVSFLKYK